ncbi:hypothetical protein K1T71_006627 [Dendrolimus kikuchii]|uniref:Uncharacterized protein n=1 Tax=Dendrolimus kikuchii TaxID=765133 RepID=A0ACC1D1C9_9NEOP|nr:hypothetical protein K1T71_006627 [Dendrolimus kikuchii]
MRTISGKAGEAGSHVAFAYIFYWRRDVRELIKGEDRSQDIFRHWASFRKSEVTELSQVVCQHHTSPDYKHDNKFCSFSLQMFLFTIFS